MLLDSKSTIPPNVRRNFISSLRNLNSNDLEASVGIATAENWKAAFDAMDPTVFTSTFSQDKLKTTLQDRVQHKGEPEKWMTMDRREVQKLAEHVHRIMSQQPAVEAQSANSEEQQSGPFKVVNLALLKNKVG